LGLTSIAVAVTLWERALRAPDSLQVYGGALLGSLGISFAATGFTAGVSALLIAGGLLRLGVALWRVVRISPLLALVSPVSDAAVTPLDTVQQDALGRGLLGAVRGVMSGAQRLRDTVEHGFFEQTPARMGQAVMDGARTLHGSVEEGGLENLLQGTARAVISVSRGIQQIHTGKLRTGILWVVLSLLAVVLLARAR
jgi:hypothetical protein